MKTSIRLCSMGMALSILLLACSKSEKSVPVKIMLTDNPTAYDSVKVHITDIKVKVNSDDAGWIDLNTKDTTVDLLTLQNNVKMALAEGEVPDGILKEVRFILGDGNYVVINDVRHDMATPSAESSGLKIKIDKELNESLNTFVLDFDAALSINEENGTYILAPVIKLKP